PRAVLRHRDGAPPAAGRGRLAGHAGADADGPRGPLGPHLRARGPRRAYLARSVRGDPRGRVPRSPLRRPRRLHRGQGRVHAAQRADDGGAREAGVRGEGRDRRRQRARVEAGRAGGRAAADCGGERSATGSIGGNARRSPGRGDATGAGGARGGPRLAVVVPCSNTALTMAAGAAVALTGLTRRFGNIVAVDGLTFDIRPGELFGIVGPDGAGKTTTLRMLAGVLPPSAGDATIAGVSVARDPEAVKPRLAYMAQRFGLYEDLTVRENIEFYADLYRVPARVRPARLERLYRFSNLGEFEGRLAGALSGGMKQKLALCCALIHQPELLL